MTKGLRIFLVVAVVWLGVWVMGSVLFFRASASEAADADYLGGPLGEPRRGEDVRLEGTIEDTSSIEGPLSGEPCVAALVRVDSIHESKDSNGESRRTTRSVANRWWGPPRLGVRVGEHRVEVPLEGWEPRSSTADDSSALTWDLPPHLLVPEDAIQSARSSSPDRFIQFSVDETRLVAGTAVFLAARVGERDGTLLLEPDSRLGRIELYRGTQASLVEDLRGASFGFRVAGWVFAAVSGVPLLVLVFLFLRKKPTKKSRKTRQSDPAPSPQSEA